ncbi:MAG: hypothetical protein SFT81_08105 [Candidatus Caenarcaniphilales bacterium]|nr:hypothetical protein [Candidatus Caenarcaniphilales bacterium]
MNCIRILLGLGRENASRVVTLASNTNVPLVWVKDQAGNPLARFLTSIDENGRLWVYPVYQHTSGNINLPLAEFRQAYSEFLGLDLSNALRDSNRWIKPSSFFGIQRRGSVL